MATVSDTERFDERRKTKSVYGDFFILLHDFMGLVIARKQKFVSIRFYPVNLVVADTLCFADTFQAMSSMANSSLLSKHLQSIGTSSASSEPSAGSTKAAAAGPAASMFSIAGLSSEHQFAHSRRANHCKSLCFKHTLLPPLSLSLYTFCVCSCICDV